MRAAGSADIMKSQNLRVMTNMANLAALDPVTTGIEFVTWPRQALGFWGRLKAVMRALRCDYIYFDGLHIDALLLLTVKRLLPFNRTRVVVMNLLTTAPQTPADRRRFAIIAWCLRGAWRIVQYHKDTRELQHYLGVPAERFVFIPFKVNQLELAMSMPVTDGGYLFCGGKTRRDFDTFIEAVSGLPYPVKIVTTANEDIAQHGSYLAEQRQFPPNVEVVRLDGSARPFIELVAACRAVVMPIKPDICGVGIGVYLLGMALRKCVIVAAGPSTTADLEGGLAVIVPPQKPAELRAAIERVWNDADYRERIAARGHEYAMQCAGEERLLRSIAAWIAEDARGRVGAAVPA
jgi:glycosyltransferase involved in cell wall biosynthesis